MRPSNQATAPPPRYSEPPPPYTPQGGYQPQGFQGMQYPPPGAPGQYAPPGGPRQYAPPGAPGQYAPPGAPGQYAPPGAPGQYAPGGPRQYPPPGAPGQYPPPGAPGQHPPPGAPGQYPPTGAPGQYFPPGQYRPPMGAPGQHVPPPNVPPTRATSGPDGYDTVDPDPDNYIRTKNSSYPVQVSFTNRSGTKVTLLWVDEQGRREKITSLKANVSKDIDTWVTHPFLIESKNNEFVINGNFVFLPQLIPGRHASDRAEITKAPKINTLRSPASGQPVSVMFSNRTDLFITIKWINSNGQQQPLKDIAPKKAWVLNSCEGHYFVACERGQNQNELELNKGLFYMIRRGSNPQQLIKVIITEKGAGSSSSSSS